MSHFAENGFLRPTPEGVIMGWQLYAENEDEKVLEKQRDDGGTEYLHFYKDESLSQEAAASREKGQDHDHITFFPDGSLNYDSTQL